MKRWIAISCMLGHWLAMGAPERACSTVLQGVSAYVSSSRTTIDDFMTAHFFNPVFLGAGGEGFVYLTRGPNGGDLIVKVPHPSVKRPGRRFRHQLRISRLIGENRRVCGVREVSVVGERQVLYLNFVSGKSLSDRIESGDVPSSVEGKIRWMLSAGQALQVFHDKGILHGDVKPHNFMVTDERGHMVILDYSFALPFGTSPGARASIPGTPYYMHPGRRAGESTAPSHDLYSLARTYENLLFPETLRALGRDGEARQDVTTGFDLPETLMLRGTSVRARSPYTMLKRDPRTRHHIPTGYEIVSILAYHPWNSVGDYVSAHEAALKAIEAGKPALFFSEHYEPEVISPLRAASPDVVRRIVAGAEELPRIP